MSALLGSGAVDDLNGVLVVVDAIRLVALPLVFVFGTVVGKGIARRVELLGYGYLRLWLLAARPGARIRFSASALLDLEDEDGDQLLVRERPEAPDKTYWGPPGGVIKVFTSSRTKELFDGLGVHSDTHHATREDMTGDLRRFVPARHFGAFVDWFLSGQNRESPDRALLRELLEELGPHSTFVADAVRSQKLPLSCDTRPTIALFKEPGADGGKPLWHCRVFYVLRLEAGTDEEWVREFRARDLPAGLAWFTTQEITDAVTKGGLRDGSPVGTQSLAVLPKTYRLPANHVLMTATRGVEAPAPSKD